jgi:hypothetical protein
MRAVEREDVGAERRPTKTPRAPCQRDGPLATMPRVCGGCHENAAGCGDMERASGRSALRADAFPYSIARRAMRAVEREDVGAERRPTKTPRAPCQRDGPLATMPRVCGGGHENAAGCGDMRPAPGRLALRADAFLLSIARRAMRAVEREDVGAERRPTKTWSSPQGRAWPQHPERSTDVEADIGGTSARHANTRAQCPRDAPLATMPRVRGGCHENAAGCGDMERASGRSALRADAFLLSIARRAMRAVEREDVGAERRPTKTRPRAMSARWAPCNHATRLRRGP